jgi:ketosteroid isomerase-like protein
MSEQNAEAIRQQADAWNRADLDAFLDFYDSNAEVITDPLWLDPGPFKGEAAIRSFFEDMRRAWTPDSQLAITQLRAMGDIVVVQVEGQVRGRSSEIGSDLSISSVTRFERRKIVRQRWFFAYADALDAAGLSE